MTIPDVLDDPNLLGAFFPDRASWTASRALLAALSAVPMAEPQAALYRRHTGRQVRAALSERARMGVTSTDVSAGHGSQAPDRCGQP